MQALALHKSRCIPLYWAGPSALQQPVLVSSTPAHTVQHVLLPDASVLQAAHAAQQSKNAPCNTLNPCLADDPFSSGVCTTPDNAASNQESES